MEAVDWLRQSGVTAEYHAALPGHGADATLDVIADDRRVHFVIVAKRRTPYPHELDRLAVSMRSLGALGRPMLVAPFISETLAAALATLGWSWADSHGNFELRGPGLWLRQRRVFAAPKPKQRTLPRGTGSFAIIRALLRAGAGEEPGATVLAERAGVSQPRVSQVLHRLRDLGLTEQAGRGHWRPRREALLDRFLAEYPGPGGSEHYFYSLDTPADVAVRTAAVSRANYPVAVSADVGPDLIEPWRRPSLVILYVREPIDPTSLGLVEAQGQHDANVIVRDPDDRSVFPSPVFAAELRSVSLCLADPAQQVWDLTDLGGADRVEAAGRLREWLLRHPLTGSPSRQPRSPMTSAT
jgi:hypothetical protein